MGLAEKQLLMRRISVNFEVSHARISTIVVTSSISRAEMTYLVRKEACVGEHRLSKETMHETWMRSCWLLVCLA